MNVAVIGIAKGDVFTFVTPNAREELPTTKIGQPKGAAGRGRAVTLSDRETLAID